MWLIFRLALVAWTLLLFSLTASGQSPPIKIGLLFPFDRYQQVITPVYITRVERRGNRLVNAVIDRIAETSQEQSWKWWNK